MSVDHRHFHHATPPLISPNPRLLITKQLATVPASPALLCLLGEDKSTVAACLCSPVATVRGGGSPSPSRRDERRHQVHQVRHRRRRRRRQDLHAHLLHQQQVPHRMFSPLSPLFLLLSMVLLLFVCNQREREREREKMYACTSLAMFCVCVHFLVAFVMLFLGYAGLHPHRVRQLQC